MVPLLSVSNVVKRFFVKLSLPLPLRSKTIKTLFQNIAEHHMFSGELLPWEDLCQESIDLDEFLLRELSTWAVFQEVGVPHL